MECANTNALNKYQEKLKKQELSYDMLLNNIDDDLAEIQEMIDKVKRVARDYDGYDFSEDIEDLLKDML